MQDNTLKNSKNLKNNKILICASEYYPEGTGIANVAYNVVEMLKKKGFHCLVCSPSGPDIKIGNSRLIKHFGIVGLLFYWFKVSNHFKKNKFVGSIWLHNPLFILKSPFINVLVTMHSTYNGKYLQFRKDNNKRTFLIYNKIVAIIERYCLKKLNEKTAFSVVSPEIIKELKQIGIKNKKITYIPNGVDAKLFQPGENKNNIRRKFGIPKDYIVLLSVGLLSDVKQPLKLIDLFSIMSKINENIYLAVAGSGQLFESVKQKIIKNQLKNIRLLGPVSYKNDLPLLYSCSDYFILTSKYEGQPLTILEAMASGLPCIVSNISNLQFVLDEHCGIMIDTTNLEKSAKITTEYISRDNSISGLNARKYILEKCDWEIIVNKYIETFPNLN